MGCGSSSAAAAQAPQPVQGGSEQQAHGKAGKAGGGGPALRELPENGNDGPSKEKASTPYVYKPRTPRPPSDTSPIKIWVKCQDSGRASTVTLTGENVDDSATCEGLAKVLTSPALIGRMQQLGLEGSIVVVLSKEGNIRPPREKVGADELSTYTDAKKALIISSPPKWSTAQKAGGLVVETSTPRTVSTTAGSVSPSSKTFGSPASMAHKAEIDAIVKKHSNQPVSPRYKANDVVEEIKRDMHSHLKKEGSSSALQVATEEVAKAMAKPKEVSKVNTSTTKLPQERLEELKAQMEGFLDSYQDKRREDVLKELKKFIHPECWADLEKAANKEGGAWSGVECILWLRAYIDFAKHHGLGSKDGKMRLELREEQDAYYPAQIYTTPSAKKAFALIPVEWTLVRSFGGTTLNYLLDNTGGYGLLSKWASGRFLHPELCREWDGPVATQPVFGFCGQLPGVSKQVTITHPGVLNRNNRDECLQYCQADDVNEYPIFDKAGMDAYLVQIEMGRGKQVDEVLKPMVVLDAAVLSDELGGDWQTMAGYGPGNLPGFSSGGYAIMLINSKKVEASNPEQLNSLGITCSKLPHE